MIFEITDIFNIPKIQDSPEFGKLKIFSHFIQSVQRPKDPKFPQKVLDNQQSKIEDGSRNLEN